MKKILNKLKHNTLFGFIFGGLIFGSIGIYGTNVYQSNSIEYSPTDSSWEVNNVNDAINSLYSNVTELENIKSIGDATSAQILSGKKAVVKGSTVTGTMTNRGAWTNTPTGSGKVTIPAGYHNGNGYVDTATIYNSGYNAGAKNSNKILETGKCTFGQLGYENTSSWSTVTFSKSYTAEDNVYLIVYQIDQSDAWTNIYVRGTGKVTGNSKNLQITNKGSVNSPGATIHWALVQMS